ncbi:hypothetical protein H0H87_005985 [Tephrocybe sp. NHM501043]|nr:hypothetical protein H0H87_005985 [Tephrocybe sp. NHM501043]
MSDPGGSHSCFPANPDVSGIGVRSAIYAQNLLSFAPALLALKDRKVTPTELDALERQSTTILITAFAILVTTIIQTRTNGISNYHASIVLELSWMNNTNLVNLFDDELNEEARSNLQAKSQLARWIYEAKKAVTNPVIIIGSLHLSLMAAVGMWLWSQPAHFGNSLLPCSLSASVVIVGNAVPLGSPQLRAWSILIYSILLVPFLNLIIPIAFFAIPLILYNRKKRVRLQRVVFGLGILGVIDAILLVDTEIGIKKNTEKFLLGHDEGQWTFGQILALLLLLVPLRDLGESILERRGRSLGKRLEAASTDGEEELVRYMLGLGVNRDTLSEVPDKISSMILLMFGNQTHHFAMLQKKVIWELFNSFCSTTRMQMIRVNFFPSSTQNIQHINSCVPDVNGNSALILAAKKQHEDIIKILLGIYKTDKGI